MKKYFAMAMVAVMALGVMTGCGGSKEAAPETEKTEGTEAEATGDKKTFTIGFDAEYPPYGYLDDNGKYVGFDIDLATEVCARNGWEFVPEAIAWDSKDMSLDAGLIDCIWSGFTMTGREDKYTWSDPYVDNSIIFVVRKDGGIATKEDLAGKVVVTQADSSGLAALQADEALTSTFASLEQVPDYNTAFLNLESGVVDAIAVDIGVGQYHLNTKSDTLTRIEEPLTSEEYGIGFKLGNEELRDQVQATLNEMAADGTVDAIVQNYTDYALDQMVCLGK